MSRAWTPHDLTNLMNWRGIGMSYAEIAQALDRSVDAVREKIRRPNKQRIAGIINQYDPADSLERHARIYETAEAARRRKKLYGQQRYEDRRCAA